MLAREDLSDGQSHAVSTLVPNTHSPEDVWATSLRRRARMMTLQEGLSFHFEHVPVCKIVSVLG